jgi:vacuolar-type H+-ATPase subunit E/Vma4
MALDDLLRAIEAEAEEERRRADREKAAAAAAILDAARREAAAVEAELTTAPEAVSMAAAERVRALARLRASNTVRVAREEAYAALLRHVGEELAASRDSPSYPAVLRALLEESRAALPNASELRVDPRDADLAMSMAGDLRVVAILDTWGGVELTAADRRTVRNTLEERLANADLLMRGRFAQWLATGVGAEFAEVP